MTANEPSDKDLTPFKTEYRLLNKLILKGISKKLYQKKID